MPVCVCIYTDTQTHRHRHTRSTCITEKLNMSRRASGACRAPARDAYIVFRRGVGAALEQYLHHRSVPKNGGFVQAGIPGLVQT